MVLVGMPNFLRHAGQSNIHCPPRWPECTLSVSSPISLSDFQPVPPDFPCLAHEFHGDLTALHTPLLFFAIFGQLTPHFPCSSPQEFFLPRHREPNYPPRRPPQPDCVMCHFVACTTPSLPHKEKTPPGEFPAGPADSEGLRLKYRSVEPW